MEKGITRVRNNFVYSVGIEAGRFATKFNPGEFSDIVLLMLLGRISFLGEGGGVVFLQIARGVCVLWEYLSFYMYPSMVRHLTIRLCSKPR